jgi:hypothetical protein
MAKQTLSTRLEPDTKSTVEEYADEREISQTVAARRLIRAGLDEKGYQIEADDRRRFDITGLPLNVSIFVLVAIDTILTAVFLI